MTAREANDSPNGPTILWFRDDLRLADNPALQAAVERSEPIVAVYVMDEESSGIRPLGAGSKWWLHGSLLALASSLQALGAGLVLRRGPAAAVLLSLIAETGASAVVWNRRYGAAERAVDTEIKQAASDAGIDARSFQGSLLHEPWTVTTQQGGTYSVFTPFWRACVAKGEPRHPLPSPDTITPFEEAVASDELDTWALRPERPDWAGGLRDAWTPGERGATERLTFFIEQTLDDYAEHRDEPAVLATSNLSPHLRFGEVSPFTVYHAAEQARRGAPARRATSATKFLAELGWREFSYNLLFHNPELATRNFRPEFDAFPWPDPDARALRAWQRGETGFPLVDAGMRQLWKTGYMHNRVRMIAASFLIKNLMIDWRIGEQWFWDTLVDADPASNAASWQWVAGSGADAAPYFRVFNPELQQKKFDPTGAYAHEFIPELGTPAYPRQIVDLGETRQAALAAFEAVKRGKAASASQPG